MSVAKYHLNINLREYRRSPDETRCDGAARLTVGGVIPGVEVTLETQAFVILAAGESLEAATVDALRCLASVLEGGARQHGLARLVETKWSEQGKI